MKHLAVIPIVLLQVLVYLFSSIGSVFMFLSVCFGFVLRKLLDWRDE